MKTAITGHSSLQNVWRSILVARQAAGITKPIAYKEYMSYLIGAAQTHNNSDNKTRSKRSANLNKTMYIFEDKDGVDPQGKDYQINEHKIDTRIAKWAR